MSNPFGTHFPSFYRFIVLTKCFTPRMINHKLEYRSVGTRLSGKYSGASYSVNMLFNTTIIEVFRLSIN